MARILVDRRRLRKALDWRSAAALVADTKWRLALPCPDPLANASLAAVRVAWPKRYQHPNARPFVQAIHDAFAERSQVHYAEIDQPYEGIVIIRVDAGHGWLDVALDYFDFTHVNESCANNVAHYFKMQHLRTGYAPLKNVHPGGYVASSEWFYRNWCRLRRLHRESQQSRAVFGRFGLRFSGDIRRRAVEILSNDRRFEFNGGTRQTKLSWYLREMARAAMCIDLPGNGPFCYRLVESMAMGCCVIGPPHATRMPVELRPGVEVLNCREDLSDLGDLCAFYAQNPAAAAEIGEAAARYFDRHLHPLRLVSNYVDMIRREPQQSGAAA